MSEQACLKKWYTEENYIDNNKGSGVKYIFITRGSTVINCITGRMCNMYKDDGLTLEEADNRMVCHVCHMIDNGILNIKIRTVDSDVIVILAAFMEQFLQTVDSGNDLRVWCDFGTGAHRKTVAIHSLYDRLGVEVCLALLFFHAFTGCDSTTSFFGLPKNKWFASWMCCPMRDDITTAFQQLSWFPKRFTIESCIPTIQRFVSYVYTKVDMELSKARLSIYQTAVMGGFRVLPPTPDALELHIIIKRSCYQAGWIWGNTISQQKSYLPTEWGWHLQHDRLAISWTRTSSLGTLLLSKLITTCKCTTAKCTSCKSSTVGPCLK